MTTRQALEAAREALCEVTPADRELFIYLLGFDGVRDEACFPRILRGEFDHWDKMKRIAAHRKHGARAALAAIEAALAADDEAIRMAGEQLSRHLREEAAKTEAGRWSSQ